MPKVTLISKKGDKKASSYHRPISLTSVIGKLLEDTIKGKIVTYLENHSLMASVTKDLEAGNIL